MNCDIFYLQETRPESLRKWSGCFLKGPFISLRPGAPLKSQCRIRLAYLCERYAFFVLGERGSVLFSIYTALSELSQNPLAITKEVRILSKGAVLLAEKLPG